MSGKSVTYGNTIILYVYITSIYACCMSAMPALFTYTTCILFSLVISVIFISCNVFNVSHFYFTYLPFVLAVWVIWLCTFCSLHELDVTTSSDPAGPDKLNSRQNTILQIHNWPEDQQIEIKLGTIAWSFCSWKMLYCLQISKLHVSLVASVRCTVKHESSYNQIIAWTSQCKAIKQSEVIHFRVSMVGGEPLHMLWTAK